jgi:serine/threonine-protein kinase HipA
MISPISNQLNVWLLNELVGSLTQINGRLSFCYAADFLAKKPVSSSNPPFVLSQSLPLRMEPFDDAATRPFFAGLLPEGGNRKLIAQTLHVSRQNDFALLDSLGGECAGAVTLLELGQKPNLISIEMSAHVRWLNAKQLLDLLDEMPLRPMLAGDEGLRLSLAGAQDKLPVVLHDDGVRIGLPLYGSPSTHILKPPISAVDGSVFNEGFCMALASALKLDVAKAKIHQIADQPNPRYYLLVERYDREVATSHTSTTHSKATSRVHQEDFCQALGVAPETKYQSEGGPNLAYAFELLRRATRPSAPQTLKLLDFVVFNALIGNHDAHGKNFSLLYTDKGAVLAPLYDALCTAVYPNLTDKMAMKIGSKYKFSEVEAKHWEQFAIDAALSPALVKKRIVEIAKSLPNLAHATHAVFETENNDHPIIGQIVTLIEQRCALTIRRLVV